MVGTSAQSIEELFLGHQQTSTLEGRVAASVSLLVCFGSAISMILNALFTTVEQTSLSALGTILGGAVYLYLRKTGRWEPLALPGCLAFLAVVSVAWATDTGSYSTAGFFFFMVATVAAIILRRRHVPWFVTLMILAIGTLLVREHFAPLPVPLDAKSRFCRLGDTALTLSLCLVVIATQLRIVIGQHVRDMEDIRRAMDEIRTLRGMLPICSKCKKIRDRSGYWNRIEEYIVTHSEAEFSHGYCPECLADLYGEYGLTPGPKEVQTHPAAPPPKGGSRSTARSYSLPHPVEELLIGNFRTTPLEGRIFNAIVLLIFLISLATTIIHVILGQLSEVCATSVGMALSGALYVYLRKSKKQEPLLLPACIAFLWLLSLDWAFDPAGSYGSDSYFYMLIGSIMPLALRPRHKTGFVAVTVVAVGGILFKESLYPPIVTLDVVSRHHHMLDIAIAMALCLSAIFATVRLVIREHIRDKYRLAAALDEIKVLRGLLPICAKCKKIRDRQGYWNLIEEYMANHSEAEFSECLCPDCLKRTLTDSRAESGDKGLRRAPRSGAVDRP